MKYYDTKHKLNELWTKTKNNENDISKLEKYNLHFVSKNHKDRILKYETDWFLLSDTAGIKNVEIELGEITDGILPFIRVIPVYKTEDAWESYVDTNVFKSDSYFGFRYTFQKSQNVYYLKVYFYGYFYDENNDELPIQGKIIITFPNEARYNEVFTRKT